MLCSDLFTIYWHALKQRITHQLLASTQQPYHKQVHLKKFSSRRAYFFLLHSVLQQNFRKAYLCLQSCTLTVFNTVFIYNIIYGEEYRRKHIQPTKHIFFYLWVSYGKIRFIGEDASDHLCISVIRHLFHVNCTRPSQ